jgi:putative phosphoribosyl transferase
MFKNRLDAAKHLAKVLQRYHGANPLVLGIPRGAVPMAQLIAQQLNGEMDVVLVRKLRAPLMPEVAVGAIDANGKTCVAPYAHEMGADATYLQKEQNTQLALLQRRRQQYDAIRQAVNIVHRTVIVVDDGLATGATMIAALQFIRQQKPARLVCAVPVASPEALEKVRPWADELVCLFAPTDFQGVGQFYSDFEQVEDKDVLNSLRQVFGSPPKYHPPKP